jgi:hypothetical protein
MIQAMKLFTALSLVLATVILSSMAVLAFLRWLP